MKMGVLVQAGDAFAGSTCGGSSGELIQMILQFINPRTIRRRRSPWRSYCR
jgi:hypothetical protein